MNKIGPDFMGITEVNVNSRSIESIKMRREVQRHTKSRVEYKSNREYDPSTVF